MTAATFAAGVLVGLFLAALGLLIVAGAYIARDEARFREWLEAL